MHFIQRRLLPITQCVIIYPAHLGLHECDNFENRLNKFYIVQVPLMDHPKLLWWIEKKDENHCHSSPDTGA